MTPTPYLLQVTYPNGNVNTVAFPTALERQLYLILLAPYRVTVRLLDGVAE